MSVFDVRLVPDHPEASGRGGLALLAGYLCCLCAFEWSHLWAFSPFVFRPGTTLALTLSFLFCLAMFGVRKERRVATALVAICWVGVTSWPLKMTPVIATLWFAALSLAVLVRAATGRSAVVGLAVALMLSLTLLGGVWPWPVTATLAVAVATEVLRTRNAGKSSAASGTKAKQRLAADAESRSMDVTWKGFAALFKVAQPGEGERFTGKVLADTAQIIEDCGGRRVKGSDLNGTYRFANQETLERCHEQLQRYEVSIQEVLVGIGAPQLVLVVDRLEPTSP